MVGQARRRISSPPMLLFARWRSLVDQGLEEVGIRSTGAFNVVAVALLVLARRADPRTLPQGEALCVLHVSQTARWVLPRRSGSRSRCPVTYLLFSIRIFLTYVLSRRPIGYSGTYCLLVVAYILDLLTPELLDGTPAFIASCQTYEGGFSSASQPYYIVDAAGGKTLLGDVRPPLGEAHGGYTFCALASWIMLKPYLDQTQPRSTTQGCPSIDYKRLLRWLVQMQGAEIELGGFRGRTNKLVDGCYSWWVGGCFALLASQGVGSGSRAHDAAAHDTNVPADAAWDDDVDGEQPHIEYHHRISRGNSSDKRTQTRCGTNRHCKGSSCVRHNTRLQVCGINHPSTSFFSYPFDGELDALTVATGRSADAYHTLYCLAGLSAAQHCVNPLPARRAQVDEVWQEDSGDDPLCCSLACR